MDQIHITRDFKNKIKRLAGPIPIIWFCSAVLLILSFLVSTALHSDTSGSFHFWILIFSSLGVFILLFFLAVNLVALVRQKRRGEIGSRLTIKLVAIFLFLTLIPFSLIYYFSTQFLSKGIDNWFDVRVEQAIKDSLLLGQTSLDAIKQEMVADVEDYTSSFSTLVERGGIIRLIEEIRERENYSELSFYTQSGRIIAFSSDDPSKLVPDTPGEDAFSQLRLNQTYTSLEPLSDNAQQLRVVAPVYTADLGRSFHALQAIKTLPLRYAKLARSVESASSQYDQMLFSRGPLRFSLILTLTIISLASLLFSLLAGIYLSRRIVSPISSLATATKQIAAGNYKNQIPVTSNDELGILVGSFNDMTQKINQARHTAEISQKQTEAQRSYLEAVLSNLSSGVLSFDTRKKLRTSNTAAEDILGFEIKQHIDKTLYKLSKEHDNLEPFFSLIEKSIQEHQTDWQEEINILGTRGRQMLILRGSTITTPDHKDNHVIVFDDVTNLIQAQRDAAWGEVARRLAHEIKNPLTPIQLSAERIRDKFVAEVNDELQPALERSTRTIVQQVESMKEMVNDFSSYAQPVRAKLAPLNVNQLIHDVVDLHQTTNKKADIKFALDENLPTINANASAMRQVLNNLIINAHHAVEDKTNPVIKLSSRRAKNIVGEYIDLIVEDNGAGIPKEIRDSMFDPYVSSKAKGSGLGLAIVKRIVEEHSGTVWAESGKTYKTRLCVRLPVNAQQTYRGSRKQAN